MRRRPARGTRVACAIKIASKEVADGLEQALEEEAAGIDGADAGGHPKRKTNEAADVGVVDPPVHVHEADRVELLVPRIAARHLRQLPVERIGSLVNVITYQLTPSTRLRLERVY